MTFSMRASNLFPLLLSIFALLGVANAYWLMGLGVITRERLDPIVSANKVSSHVHAVAGGSHFTFNTSTALLRKSTCTSTPISQDKSNYWVAQLYFQFKNGSFMSVDGGMVTQLYYVSIDYLFSDKAGTTTAFPDDFRMVAGDPTLRTYNASSFAQQAVTYLCLDFHGTSTKYNEFPNKVCPDGIRAQINFPSCWDGKNVDSSDHKSHVAYLSNGPDSGSCKDPKFPVTLPRIFMEVYWATPATDKYRSQAMNSSQPYVLSTGDSTGYSHHADFANGWDEGVLQRAVDQCHCNPFGDPTCCSDQGIFTFNPKGNDCHITPQIDEVVLGTIPKLPGNNPVTGSADAVNGHVASLPDPKPPQALYPATAYTTTPPPNACSVGGKLGSACTRGPPPGAQAGAGAPPVSISSAAPAPPVQSHPASDPPASVSTTAPVQSHSASSPMATPSAPVAPKAPNAPIASRPMASQSAASVQPHSSFPAPPAPAPSAPSSSSGSSNSNDSHSGSGTCPAGKKHKAHVHMHKAWHRRIIH